MEYVSLNVGASAVRLAPPPRAGGQHFAVGLAAEDEVETRADCERNVDDRERCG